MTHTEKKMITNYQVEKIGIYECIKCNKENLSTEMLFNKYGRNPFCRDCYDGVYDEEDEEEEEEEKDEKYICKICCDYDKEEVGIATGENGVEMIVCKYCDVDGDNYNGWGDKEESENEQVCFKCNRGEKECQENTDNEINPITQWIGICGLLCDDCYYEHYASEDEEEDDEDVNSGGSDGEDYSTNISIANY